LSIRLLGSFQVTLDGEPVTGFESDKVRALLAYLAIETGQPHRREKLAGLFWPELPERSARNNLRVSLANLRKVTRDHARARDREAVPPFILVTRQTIQLNPEADIWLDVSALTKRLEATGRPQRVIPQLAEAAELYRGGFLEGLSFPDSAALEEWALLKREQLQQEVVAGLHRLAGWHEQRGEFQQALPYARRQVSLEPWQEQGQRQVMRLLAITGQRNAALAQYQALRRMLAAELGVEPEDETEALYRRARDGRDLHLLTPGPPHNLPTPLAPFVGREKELDQIYSRLQDPRCRLLNLVGPGGSGKTRLALEASADQVSSAVLSAIDGHPASERANGIFFVSLARLQSAEGITPAVADAVGFTFHSERDPWQQLLDYLRQKQMLLILDNFEHLLEGGAGWVTEVLKTAPRVQIMVTSRSWLSLQAEDPFPLAGMAMPDDHALSVETPGALRRYDGIELFSISASRNRPDFRLTAGNAADVVRICRLVDGMPLGILLAAAWVDTMTPTQIASEIGQSLDFLAGDWEDLPERQRSLRAVFDHTWTQLGERDQESLQTLSVFRGGFTYKAVRTIAGTSLKGLKRLVNRSLLYHMPSGRYEMHELLRQYAAEKLEAAGQAGVASNAHSAYFAAALMQWGMDLRGPKQLEALEDMELEIGNARGAWQWAAEHGDVARLAPALDGLCHFYEWRVRYREGEAACRVAAKRLSSGTESPTGTSVDGQRLLGRVLVWQRTFTYLLGRMDPALQLMRRGLALMIELEEKGHDTRVERGHALLQTGIATLDIDRKAAKVHCE
jgi:predicted ATPase/DNA-binding SARP family transcriptional activator